MPSPLGHAVAGLAIAWSAEALRREPIRVGQRSTLAVTCASLAVAPDLDFLYPPVHRMMTHSLLAILVTALVVAIVRGNSRVKSGGVVAVVCALAYGSHLLLDWLGGDTKLPAGIQLLWPFSDEWFISPFGLFRATDLGGFFKPHVMLSNALAVLRELVVVVPFALGVYAWRRARLQPAFLQERRSPVR